MSDEQAVVRKLASLGADNAVFRDGARVISNGLMPPSLAAILDEIDNTVLKRTLTFRLGDSRLSLSVAGRRILTVLAASGDLADAQPLIGLALSPDEIDGRAALLRVLAQLATHQDSVLLETMRPDDSAGQTDIGIPVAVLAEELGFDLGAPSANAMELFIDACGMIFVACLIWTKDGWAGQAQDEAILTQLRQIAERQWDAFCQTQSKLAPSPGKPQLITLEAALVGGGSLSLVFAQDQCGLFAHDQSDLTEIHDTWRRIFTL